MITLGLGGHIERAGCFGITKTKRRSTEIVVRGSGGLITSGICANWLCRLRASTRVRSMLIAYIIVG